MPQGRIRAIQIACLGPSAPLAVGQAHVPDQTADLPWHPRPTALKSRLPAPMQTKAGSMPPDNSLWPDNGDNAQRRRKQPIKLDEDQSIDHRQRRLTART